MKSTISLVIVLLALSIVSFGQMTPVGPKTTKGATAKQKDVKVIPLNLPKDYNAGEMKGNLKDGVRILNLRWAESSSVACFPGTRFEMFNGNHVLYRMTMPAASKLKITVTPKDGKAINLYALRQGMRQQQTPPNVTRAISCESSYPIYANVTKTRRVTNKDDGIRKVEYISVSSPYSILIGVAGAEGLTEGDFTLKVEIAAR